MQCMILTRIQGYRRSFDVTQVTILMVLLDLKKSGFM
jgi:hypothetical protein